MWGYLHAAYPKTPSIESRIADAIREPNALLIMMPHDRMAVLSPNSLGLYHLERRNKAPGKNAASTNPMKNRVRRAPVYLPKEQLRQGNVKKCRIYVVVVPE
jgi:hypothetical protein